MIDISRTLSQLHVRFSKLGGWLQKEVICDRQRLFCSITCQPTEFVMAWVKAHCKDLDIPRRCIKVCDHTCDVSDVHVSVELGVLVDERADTFDGLKEYLILRKGLRHYEDFTVSEDIQNMELYLNGYYFCSVGEYEPGVYEVFELHHGAEVSEDGKEWLTDGELWQYKTFKNLKSAVDFALSCRFKGKLPSKPIKAW